MSDTVIVVFAQSGTTIDTNVFAKMAKKRGAYTISLVNKRDGDITYIVENNLYLGNGRDVELSVPSTKTYTCHLYLGFILSDKIISTLKKYCSSINLSRLDESNDNYEVSFIIEIHKFSELNKIKNEIQNKDKNIKITFFDNKSLS